MSIHKVALPFDITSTITFVDCFTNVRTCIVGLTRLWGLEASCILCIFLVVQSERGGNEYTNSYVGDKFQKGK